MIKKGKKRGQTFSLDLVFGVIIFLVASSLFYYNLRYVPEDKLTEQLRVAEESIFNNLDFNTKDYDKNHGTSYAFLDGYRIDEIKLTNFAAYINSDNSKNYPVMKNILLWNIVTSYEIDLCIFFEDENDNIVPINNFNGIGNSTNNGMKIGNNNCGVIASGSAKPSCEGYKYARNLFRGVVRDMKNEPYMKIYRLNVLICAREKS